MNLSDGKEILQWGAYHKCKPEQKHLACPCVLIELEALRKVAEAVANNIYIANHDIVDLAEFRRQLTNLEQALSDLQALEKKGKKDST